MKYMVFAIILTNGLFAITSASQSSHQPPDTTQQFDPETGLPVIEETELDTTQQFDPETGLPVVEEIKETGEKYSLFQFLARQPFPFQFFGGLPLGSQFFDEGVNMGISWRYRDKYEFFNLHPKITLGLFGGQGGPRNLDIGEVAERETFWYGIIEGHRRLGMENLQASVFVGAGLGLYSYSTEKRTGFGHDLRMDGGTGPVFSAGAQAKVWRVTGDLRLLRTPGRGKFVTVANVGYQPKSYMEALALAGLGAVGFVAFLIYLFY